MQRKYNRTVNYLKSKLKTRSNTFYKTEGVQDKISKRENSTETLNQDADHKQ